MNRPLFRLCLACCFSALSLFSNDSFDPSRLNDFYDEFLYDQKKISFEAGLISSITADNGGGDEPQNFVPPPNPMPPVPSPSGAPELPVVIVNNSGAPDSEVYVTVTGKNKEDSAALAYVMFAPDGVGTLVNAAIGLEGATYAKALSEFPTSHDGHVFYLPYIESALLWFSIQDKLTLAAISDPTQPNGIGIEQPNPTNEADNNYRTLWDIFEVDYEAAGPVLFADATAVTQFNLPLYAYLSTPDATSGSNCGLYQPREYILDQVMQTFNNEPLASVWNHLFVMGEPSYSNSPITRLISTGKGIAAGEASPNYFDKNYLDNADAYGFSFLEAMWYRAESFYRDNSLALKIPSGTVYDGTVEGGGGIQFDAPSPGEPQETDFPPPSSPNTPPQDTTTFKILSGLPLFDTTTSPEDGEQLSKLFGEAIVAGFIPTAEEVSDSSVQAGKSRFYTNNPNLKYDTATTGPWYDLYSKALHSLGLIYSYAFDDSAALWPEVQIFAQGANVKPTDPVKPTYLGITVGPLEK